MGMSYLDGFRFPIGARQSIIDSEELTALELAGRTAKKLNDIVDFVNTLNDLIATKENSADITNKRKLSPTGDFSGSILGQPVFTVLSNINDALSLAKTIIDMVNNRESIGTIYDGGAFIETDPPTITVEGGLF